MTDTALLWLRRTLRLADNPALAAALASASVIVPLFIDAPGDPLSGDAGPAARAWLAHSLEALEQSLAARDSRLTVIAGNPSGVLLDLARETGATAVHADRLYDPFSRAADTNIGESLAQNGIAFHTHTCSLLREPDGPLTNEGRPFRIFTAYYRACTRSAGISSLPFSADPLPAPGRIPTPQNVNILTGANGSSRPKAANHLFARASSLAHAAQTGPPQLFNLWQPGEAGARIRADEFLETSAARYTSARDIPGIAGTSRLSPHLAFGEISPRQLISTIWPPETESARAAYIRQLYWREFACYLLYHFPRMHALPLRPEFEFFPWADDPSGLDAWKSGRTGYPLVDAGMRELAATGWMHNRMRMIAASFLTKDLLIPWHSGAEHFMTHLADADIANNTFGWQWIAGSGADAAPYFRIFNPVLQGQKYDPAGIYVRTWVPELAYIPDRFIHRPWDAPANAQADAGIVPGETYPLPIIDHAEARRRALAAYEVIREKRNRLRKN